MSTVLPEQEAMARRRIATVFAIHGTLGFLAVVGLTILNWDQTGDIIAALGARVWLLTAIYFVFAAVLQFLKFELTDLVFVSLGIGAFIAMYPVLGGVISAWTAIVTTIGTRLLGMHDIGPVKIEMSDARLEYLKAYGLFGTYGLPIVLGSVLYERLGGEYPTLTITPQTILRLAICGFCIIVANNVILARMMKAYGYDVSRRIRLLINDCSIYVLTLPYAICMTLAYGAMGWGAVAALAFTGVLANFAARNLALTRSASLQQLQRLASLSNIGKTISLQLSTEELLDVIYAECRKVVDATFFSVALLDERTEELSFEIDVRDGRRVPRSRIPLGDGLNSWVVRNHQPLLIGSLRDEKRLGIDAVSDGLETVSWLGVPMVARDRVIGVISIQTYRAHAFREEDLQLLTAVANQAAVALENATLYKDLEGLTFALEHRVHERTRELNETNLRLLAADRSKNQFLANMSHELRTPLNSIIGFSSVLLGAARDMLPARLYKFVENIQTAGNHLLELINDILDLSKIEAGKMELRPDRFDLRETVAAVERVMKVVAAESQVNVQSSVADDVPQVCLDEGRLKQILFNLLSNAVKFSPRGSAVNVIVTRIPAAESPLNVETVRIAVRDRGIGIAEAELQRIFDEFYQAEQGRRAGKGGTGLGLSLTRNFAELHHGTIEVESKLGEGSTFTLLLPVDYHHAKEMRDSGALRRVMT